MLLQRAEEVIRNDCNVIDHRYREEHVDLYTLYILFVSHNTRNIYCAGLELMIGIRDATQNKTAGIVDGG